MGSYERPVREKLSQNGCYFVRHGKGDHDIWFSPITKLPITVDNEIKARQTPYAISIHEEKS